MIKPTILHFPNPQDGRYILRSRSCLLTRRNASDAAFMRILWANSAFMHSFHRLAPLLPTSDLELQRILNAEYQNTIEKSRANHWIVRDINGHPWGLLSLTDISLLHKRSEVLMGVLPGAPFGLVTAAMLMLFRFYFNESNFNKIYSMVFPDNPRSLKTTLHLGFKQEGLLKNHMFDPNTQTYIDVIQTGLLAVDAFSPSNIRLMKKLLDLPTQSSH